MSRWEKGDEGERRAEAEGGTYFAGHGVWGSRERWWLFN